MASLSVVYFLIISSSLIYISSSILPSTISADGCSAEFSSVSTSFDLCPLRRSNPRGQLKYYKVLDSRRVNTTTTSNTNNYEYYFNVAGSLQSVPPICSNPNVTHSYCPANTDCSSYNNTITIAGNTAWAYQVKNDMNNQPIACWALSNDMDNALWQLIDDEDASLGVSLTYLNGDYDDAASCKTNRKFQIRFECEDNILFIPDEIPLYEYSPCEYTISIPSQYGCPLQCKIYDNQLCSSNGLCGYDNTNHIPHCFCFNKYTTSDCSLYDASAGVAQENIKSLPSNPNPLYFFQFENALNTNVTVTYDLGAFAAPGSQAGQNGGLYIVHDKDYDENQDRTWTYYVAISRLLNTPGEDILPEYCTDIAAPCADIDEMDPTQCNGYVGDSELYNGVGLVFQVNNATKQCFVLGRFDLPGSPSADLFDQIDDPARGVTVTYSQGSWCPAAGRNREFRVNLVCPRDQSAVYDPFEETMVDLYEYVEEEETCVYSFTMQSAVACPYQCITNTTDADNKEAFTVCNQKGICAADPQAKFVRCLCDDGWKGIYCSQIDSATPTVSPTVSPTDSAQVIEKTITSKRGGFIAIIVILAIVILVVCAIGYYIYKNQKLKISAQDDELSFYKMSDKGIMNKDTVSTNVITDDKGKRGFATISHAKDDQSD